MVEREQLDLEPFSSLASVEAIKPFLNEFSAGTAALEKPAYRFAELVGLPAYRWLSPDLAQHHTADLISEGGVKLGTKPPSAADKLRVPPSRKLVLPRPDLSAREAFTLVRPFASAFTGSWFLASVFGTSTNRDGRLALGTGAWDFRYDRDRSATYIRASLFFNGNLGFHGQIIPGIALTLRPPSSPLPSDWLDSTEIAEIVAREPLPVGLDENYSLFLSLEASAAGVPLIWEARRRSYERRTDTEHALAVDAYSGEIVVETFRRMDGQRCVEARRRLRLGGGDWEETPVDNG